MFLIGGIDAAQRCESGNPRHRSARCPNPTHNLCVCRMLLKVMPENWKEDVKIRLFLRYVAPESARTPLAEFLGIN